MFNIYIYIYSCYSESLRLLFMPICLIYVWSFSSEKFLPQKTACRRKRRCFISSVICQASAAVTVAAATRAERGSRTLGGNSVYCGRKLGRVEMVIQYYISQRQPTAVRPLPHCQLYKNPCPCSG